jgi:uncharacterized membrane protein
MRRRLLCEQRGAISVLAALSLVFVVASAAMTVDVGQAAWKKRSLQRLVDVVSLDAVRAVGDRRSSTTSCVTVAQQFAQQSADRNQFDYANTALGNSLTVEIGIGVAATKAFATTADCVAANAVRITATSRSDNRFIPGTVGLTTQAIAMMDGMTTYSLGSKLVAIDSTTSPILNKVIGGMLGGTVNLSAVGYNGLAAATVSMGAIWTNLGLGTPNQILNSDVTMGQLLDATISALNNQGDPSSVAAATTLGTLKSQITTSTHFKFGDILEGNTGDVGDAANARMDILNLIGMTASAANGTNLLNMTLPITIPGVTSTTMKLALIEGPQICWDCRVPSSIHTGQVRIQLDSTLTTKLTVLLQQGTVHLPVYLESAGATGDLTNIHCANPVSNSDITVRTTNQPVTAKVGTATDSSMNDPSVAADVRAGQIVSISGLVNVTGTATASMPTSVTDLIIPLLQTLTAGSSGVTLAAQLVSSLALTVQVLGLGVNATTVANNTLAILNPVMTTLDSTLLGPIKKALGSLGISLGAADVTNMDETCTGRRLIG